ncbi:hypothetical protein JKP88DRAFT_244840 [Tribonema minus]|uniref:Uncharacterized protein n=1 Tax=Tribonema minus TaxID=303371 RepID=A0A836CG40_9STRA|nr:hypothetical protein JKP88DRAFT_244840 [Tribonema minus]
MEFILGTALGGVLLHMYSKSQSNDDSVLGPLGEASIEGPAPANPVLMPPAPPAPIAPPALGPMSAPDFKDPEHIARPGAPVFRTIASSYPTQDISEPFSNELDGQYMNFMSTMRSGLIARKEAVKQRIERMKQAEMTSEAARVMRIVETPVPDRDPTPISSTKYPAWMHATTAPPPVKTITVLPLPPAQDIYARDETHHRKNLMSTLVGSYGKAGTSTYRNWALPVEQEWTGYGTGQGSIAPKWERPSFVLERTDEDVQPTLPPQAVASSMQPSFRSQENAALGVSRSFNLHVDTTNAPGVYAVPLGAAVVAPSVAGPVRQTTLGIGPQGTSLGVLPGGGKKPQASIRLKQGSINFDPSSLPPNQIATVAPSFASDVRLSDDTRVALLPAADASGRADHPLAPAAEMSADPDRYARDDARDARASILAATTNTVSGVTSAAATPAVQSGHDGLNYLSKEELESRTAALMRQMDVSGVYAAPAQPASESDRSDAVYLQQEAIRLKAAILKMQSSDMAGLESHATPAQYEAGERVNELVNLQDRLGDVLQRIAVTSGRADAPAAPSELDHLRDDAGINPQEPDGRGASTSSKVYL